ncbi:MAG: thioesterase [Actinophytocola sp.]|nr:thioesterase [Actinophytocola sp.]
MSDAENFSIRIKVRHYELDSLGHLNHAVYHQYAEVARLEWFESVGGGGNGLRDANIAPVLLETHVRFRRELRAADVVDVSLAVTFGEGKTFAMNSEIRQLDGTLAAEIECIVGAMDMAMRKLVGDPHGEFVKAGLRV